MKQKTASPILKTRFISKQVSAELLIRLHCSVWAHKVLFIVKQVETEGKWLKLRNNIEE